MKGTTDTQLVSEWRTPEDEYIKGNRNWLPCTEEFYWEMLEVMPPIYGPGCFAVCEAWRDDGQGNPLHLWFRDRPAYACRVASKKEIVEERNLRHASK